MRFNVISKYLFTVEGGDFLLYVNCNKEKGRVRRCLIGKISKEDFIVGSFAGTS